MQSNKAVFFSGIKWSLLSQVGNVGSNYLTIVLLSILLDPEAFGLITLSTLLIGFAEILNGFGAGQWIIGQNIVEAKKINEIIGNTLSLSFGLLVTCIICAIPFANFYSDGPVLLKILLVSSCSLPLNALNGILNDIFVQQLRFKFISKLSVISFAIANIIAVLAAWLGLGVWSLVIKNLLPTILTVCILWHYVPFRIQPRVNWAAQRDSRRFQWHFSWVNTLNYFSRNLDYLLIGHFFNTAILGQYSIAYRIMLLPLKNLSSKANSILFPLLSKQVENAPKVLSTYLKVMEGIAYLVFPLMTLIGLTAQCWVPLFFDQRYEFLPKIIEVLAIIGAFQAVSSPIGSLYLIKKQTQKMLQVAIYSLVVLSLAFAIGAYLNDIILFATMYGLAYICFIFPVSNKVGLELFEGKLSTFFQTIKIPVLAVLPLFLLAPLILSYISHPMLGLFSVLLLGTLVYLAGILILGKRNLSENLQHLKGIFSQLTQ